MRSALRCNCSRLLRRYSGNAKWCARRAVDRLGIKEGRHLPSLADAGCGRPWPIVTALYWKALPFQLTSGPKFRGGVFCPPCLTLATALRLVWLRDHQANTCGVKWANSAWLLPVSAVLKNVYSLLEPFVIMIVSLTAWLMSSPTTRHSLCLVLPFADENVFEIAF